MTHNKFRKFKFTILKHGRSLVRRQGLYSGVRLPDGPLVQIPNEAVKRQREYAPLFIRPEYPDR